MRFHKISSVLYYSYILFTEQRRNHSHRSSAVLKLRFHKLHYAVFAFNIAYEILCHFLDNQK